MIKDFLNAIDKETLIVVLVVTSMIMFVILGGLTVVNIANNLSNTVQTLQHNQLNK